MWASSNLRCPHLTIILHRCVHIQHDQSCHQNLPWEITRRQPILALHNGPWQKGSRVANMTRRLNEGLHRHPKHGRLSEQHYYEPLQEMRKTPQRPPLPVPMTRLDYYMDPILEQDWKIRWALQPTARTVPDLVQNSLNPWRPGRAIRLKTLT